ncbi:uncharacterized protein TRIADDRAFT_30401 [Trichoplax adhaerens]|uniref:Ubiquitin-like protease family profile domain-containing protein n=1 Tax=Trichoplax adhaerens TaxID=10228 RepID=B3S700_TRIAD|nr:hypothetical protein TRIADDRAFT_30401 [Trichoplax adhaerens]EDV21399.1 hypothetical protein TRIADDRAFT_30401 [Trichoplax adhaerens]|eukprot:XP_002115999.1 hypothetical protein TRIADDRAFT_30401 [Trichoplax adhaerens]
MYENVKNWTRNVNLFQKDFIVIPINERSHWYLAVLCYPYLEKAVPREIITVSDKDSNPDDESSSSKMTGRSRHTGDSSIRISKSNNCHSCNFYRFITTFDRSCILVFDSLGCPRPAVFRNLRLYLSLEWKNKNEVSRKFNSETVPGYCPKIPHQNNDCDCGLYLLQYFESFFKNPFNDYTPPIHLRKWFNLDEVSNKRYDILEVIDQIRKK